MGEVNLMSLLVFPPSPFPFNFILPLAAVAKAYLFLLIVGMSLQARPELLLSCVLAANE